ncbi:hypothetical protein Salat_0058100 [Sesamum alatum]|uniref:NB-ARC domain-containing protein n=1 Tax=Sesamum alatum TaxID=300844 RepID=A0AAE1YW80_9LAMI|nr:hypothetical protein Salat_0058100 [Sesamum alatum]
MAVAAYASLLSLTDVLDSFPHLARRHLDKEQIQILQEKVQFLQDFLELHSRRISPEMEEADDIIDFHVVNQLRERSQDKSLHSSFYQDISNIIEKIDSITKELMMVKEELIDVQEQQPGVSLPVGSTALPSTLSSFYEDINKIVEKIDSITKQLMIVKEETIHVQAQQPVVSVPVGATALPSSDKNTMVGFDERLLQIVVELTRNESNLHILPIVGMGGIGKTILVQYAFDHPHIVYRFGIHI